MALEIHEGLGFNRSTGEAIAVFYEQDSDGNDTHVIRKTVNTGWFFEDVRQPIGTNKQVVAPWNFPTPFSVAKLIDRLQDRGVLVDGFEYDDVNAQFPYTHRAARILITIHDKQMKMAAGQVIRYICARTDEFGRQEIDAVLDAEIEELLRQNEGA
jgi:hypothetical protein